MTQEEPAPVWPFEQGSKRGYAFLPLYKKAPQAITMLVRGKANQALSLKPRRVVARLDVI